MTINIGFFTGARSEYGTARKLLKHLQAHPKFNIYVFPNGMHLLENFGKTISEIEKDGFEIKEEIATYTEENQEKGIEFSSSVNQLYTVLKKHDYLDAIFLIGDRIEAYATALAAHFLKIKIIHSGGGTLTDGAIDNIYRYNISNLADIHFATSKKNFERLLNLPIIKKENVHFTGSIAVDSLLSFQKNPTSIRSKFPDLDENFALMTFHPTTKINEPTITIMQLAINLIWAEDYSIIITYPNNDEGYEEIIEIIEGFRNCKKIFISKNLGAQMYYAALQECKFVIGNSSSALIEAPYFNKPVLNIGKRQGGRDVDDCVQNIDANLDSVSDALKKGFESNWKSCTCNQLFGVGNSVQKIEKILLNYLRK